MEVLVGPTFNIEVPSSPDYVVPPPQDEHQVLVAPPSLFPEEEEAEARSQKTLISRRIGSDFGTEDSSDGSSSIGAPDDSDEEEGDGVVSSSKAGLGSLDSLEDSLPIKRGLSNHFSGKSKSFGNLAEASSVGSAKDLEKPENPFNKRRRVLMANKWSRRKSSFYSWHNPKSMPLLALNEEDDDCDEGHREEDNDEEEEEEEEDQESPALSSSSPPGREGVQQKLGIPPKAQGRKFRTASFKSQSCFSLADLELQHHQ